MDPAIAKKFADAVEKVSTRCDATLTMRELNERQTKFYEIKKERDMWVEEKRISESSLRQSSSPGPLTAYDERRLKKANKMLEVLEPKYQRAYAKYQSKSFG